MLKRGSSLPLMGFFVAGAVGCATQSPTQVLIDAQGQMKHCAEFGFDIVRVSQAQDKCVTDARGFGFLPMEEAGAVGIILNDEDKVASRVSVVLRASPAAAAGLAVGDVIVAVNGQSVPSRQAALFQLFGRTGEAVEILAHRGEKDMKFSLVRASRSSIFRK